MHWLDSTLLALLALGAGFGFISGLLWQVARVANLGLGLWATVFFHEQAVQLVQEYLLRDADANLVKGVAYTLAFLVVYCVLMLVTRLARKLLQASGFAWMDRCLGAFLGAAKTAVILGGVCLLLSRTNNANVREWMERSAVAPALATGMETTLAMIPDDYKRSVAENLMTLRSRVEEPQ